MANRYLCIHGHFYQPPREDPFTGQIPNESGAEPYRNWNERIHDECYRPNTVLRNFERISFNVGPTLCEWMESFDPETLRGIINQDKASVQRSDVGNAIAQAYHHTILPLATRADKVTQIYWGIADFVHRMGRRPLGMWLPETAVDKETLSILTEMGIRFTILAPWQAESDILDTTEAYRVLLPHDRSIAVLFYQRELSGGISFNPGLTSNADEFVQDEILTHFRTEKDRRGEPQLLLIATDGELYGHHQKFRDQFLAHLVNGASEHRGVRRTVPGLWLRENPPRRTIEIVENTSWSCLHGVIRWMGPCDCNPGDGRWKIFLRQALNKLAAEMDLLYSDFLWRLDIDPWELRNRYIEVILGSTSIEALINQAAGRALNSESLSQVSVLLQAQNERQKMFASCAWYYDDFSRIEARNSLGHAARAVWLTGQATGIDLSPQLKHDLKFVTSQRTGLRGDTVFCQHLNKAEETKCRA